MSETEFEKLEKKKEDDENLNSYVAGLITGVAVMIFLIILLAIFIGK